MPERNAVIVGAGIGGLATAIALHSRGWNIKVLERAPALREVGAGISLWPHAKPSVYAGYTTWRLIAPPTDLDSDVSESWGRGERVGIFRLADNAIYTYLIAKTPPGTTYPDNRAELHRRFGQWHAPIPAILNSVSDVLQHDIYRLPALHTYVTGRAALLGDAAHAMTPDLGQGAATALEDAVDLAEAVDGDINHGLRLYNRRRRPRTQAIARRSATFGTFAQASGHLAVPLRNTATSLLPERLFQRSNQPILTWRSN